MDACPFQYLARPQNPKGQRLFYALLLFAIALAVASVASPGYRGVIALVAVGAIVAALVVFNRYVIAEYLYSVLITGEGEPLFVVASRTGKRVTTLCRIALADIRSIERQEPKERAAHKTPAGYAKYIYLPTLAPKVCYRLTALSRYERAEILIEIDDPAAQTLRVLCEAAAADRAETEEND